MVPSAFVPFLTHVRCGPTARAHRPSVESAFHATNSSSATKWCTHFNQTDLDRIYEMYQMDYLAFGYPRPTLPEGCAVK